MPTYVYRRADGSVFELEQRITEPALETDPETGQPVTRIISGNTGLIFKGSGFYLTDYARKNGSTPPAGSSKSSTNASNGTSASSESKTPTAKATSE